VLFFEKLRQTCQAHPDKTALAFLDRDRPERFDHTLSYAKLWGSIHQTASYLASLGVRPGDRVALQLPKSLSFITLHFAIMRLGAISLPLNPSYPLHEVHYYLEDAEAKLFFTGPEMATQLEIHRDRLPSGIKVVPLEPGAENLLKCLTDSRALPPLPDDPDATVLMMYTSGTTGRPKGAELTHGNLSANLRALHQAWGWQANDTLLHVLPIFHTHGLVVALHGALYAGATTLLLPTFDAEATLNALEVHRCSVLMAVPTMHRRLLEVPEATSFDLHHVRLITSGSDRLPDELFERFKQTLGHTLLERYGMTETGMNLSNPYHGERRVGSVGLPLPGVEARVVDVDTEKPLPFGEVGEVQIRGAHVFKGYWRQPDKTAAAFTPDGWLRTGDLGLCGEDGYYTLKGRLKDLIISGGYNVYPPEVERVLAQHPAVAAGAVIGCPDVTWGERVVTVIERHAGAVLNEADVVAHCRANLAPYKIPKEVLFLTTLPRNAMGKIEKAKLRAELCSGR
jgi:malonyl-CoA/methylmalonyl-CoA synthetase